MSPRALSRLQSCPQSLLLRLAGVVRTSDRLLRRLEADRPRLDVKLLIGLSYHLRIKLYASRNPRRGPHYPAETPVMPGGARARWGCGRVRVKLTNAWQLIFAA